MSNRAIKLCIRLNTFVMTMTNNKAIVWTVLENVADVMPFYSKIVAVVLLMYLVYV